MSNKFTFLVCLFVSSLMLSNIIAGKLIVIFGQVFPGAVLLYPLVYVIGNIITEVYGFARVRTAIWTGLFINVFMVLVIYAVLLIPSPEFFTSQEAYKLVLGMTPRVVGASVCAYWVGVFINAIIMSKLKELFSGRWLWARTISSTMAGEAFDTSIFITLAFYGLVSDYVLVQMMIAQYLFKISYGIIATPIVYAAVGWLKRTETEIYDHSIKGYL